MTELGLSQKEVDQRKQFFKEVDKQHLKCARLFIIYFIHTLYNIYFRKTIFKTRNHQRMYFYCYLSKLTCLPSEVHNGNLYG